MIVCKKCGGKYEDDMPRCLWCDAPNPNYGKEVQNTAPKKVSVIKRELGEIEWDGKVFYEGAEFKLNRAKHALNILGIAFWLGLVLFYGIAWPCGFFADVPLPLRLIFLGTAIILLYMSFILSKKVLKVKWFKNKFVLCTRYGEKDIPFEELMKNGASVDRWNERLFVFKKDGKTFQVSDSDYPDVVQKLCEILDKLAEKDVVQDEGLEYVIYKPLVNIGGKSRIAVGLVGASFIAFFFPWENALFIACYAIFVFGYFCVVYDGVKAVLKIKWFSDKFVLCTHFGEKSFLFEKTAPRKIKYDKNGNCRFVFKKGWLTFAVDERYFPEVAAKMKELYSEK